MEEENNWTAAKEHLEQYALIQVKLLKLYLVEKYAGLSSSLISAALVYLVLIVAVLFISMAAAFGIGEYFGHLYLGFLCVAGFYLLLYIILRIFRRKFVKRTLMNGIIKKMYEDD